MLLNSKNDCLAVGYVPPSAHAADDLEAARSAEPSYLQADVQGSGPQDILAPASGPSAEEGESAAEARSPEEERHARVEEWCALHGAAGHVASRLHPRETERAEPSGQSCRGIAESLSGSPQRDEVTLPHSKLHRLSLLVLLCKRKHAWPLQGLRAWKYAVCSVSNQQDSPMTISRYEGWAKIYQWIPEKTSALKHWHAAMTWWHCLCERSCIAKSLR